MYSLLLNRFNMKRIQAMDCMVSTPNVADDEAYRIIVGCIKTYIRALKLVFIYI